ncbi:MAG TPA: thioredoxin domain-containing protein [Anaerolineae bacterium]|nr:thioredoxin domain-containing protein [Anaerolineae bacterium]
MKKPNRLIDETSPYLLQHAHNPVDWYPWGEEAFRKARAEDRPILVSIGYSSCHWCHVMAHESFEDEDTARLMNEHFVNIKVDREERPDVDAIYMRAVVAITGRGGWPLTVFLTPDRQPFFGGTYFPPQARHGLPAFRQVLLSVARSYRERKEEILRSAQGVVSRIISQDLTPAAPQMELSAVVLDQSLRRFSERFDPRQGGFGAAPKFPQAMVLGFLLREYYRSGNTLALRIVERTLEKMARGGLYDQVGGGFHRYSVDDRWLVPHFEKMLYDNALLSRVYLRAYHTTGKPLYRRTAEETLDYVAREMTSEEGGFYSSQDADSEGEEGKFFVWTAEEIKAALGDEDGDLFNQYFGVTEAGNFEGKNVLSVPRDLDVVAHLAQVPMERLEDVVSRGRGQLFSLREQRVHPQRDEKVITSWNGLMLASFAEAARVLDEQRYQQIAVRNADFLLRELQGNGQLYRIYAGGQRKVRGYLEDYASLIGGLLALYEATFDQRWFLEARALAEEMIPRFKDSLGAGFYDTDGEEELITRPRDWQDGALPSGNSLAADVLLRLTALTGAGEYEELAQGILAVMSPTMAQHPLSFGHLLSVLNFYLSPPEEIAIVGDPSEDDSQELLKVVYARYRPSKVVAVGLPSDEEEGPIPLLAGRRAVRGHATAYVCRRFACQQPVTTPRDLAAQLRTPWEG